MLIYKINKTHIGNLKETTLSIIKILTSKKTSYTILSDKI